MKSIIFNAPNTQCSINETETPRPGPGEARVKIIAASLNRRDYWIKKGIYQGSRYPCIVGSDGAGIIDALGSDVDADYLGKEVIINPGLNWGGNNDYHAPNFQILGLPSQGTLAEYVCVPIESIWPKPAGWTFEKAAALPLGALTAYRALFSRGQLQKGDNVFITGIGGGVAMFMLKFALAAESNVYVSSSSEKKIKKAIQLGALGGVNYKLPDWEQQLTELVPEGFALIADSAAGENFSIFPNLLRIGGRIVIFGGTAGKMPEITAAKLFWKQASILGTTMGSPEDFKNMLAFVEKHKIKPEIDKIFPMEDTEIAFKYMENQEQFGKIVIKIG
jgi:zinc-binding alcohol dehydrogenase/oxidoreductase